MLISRCLMFCLVNNKKRQAVKTLVVEQDKRYFNDKCIGKGKTDKSTSGRTHNTSIDSSIDLKSYIASTKKRIKTSLRMQEHRLMRKQVNI